MMIRDRDIEIYNNIVNTRSIYIICYIILVSQIIILKDVEFTVKKC